MSIAAPCLRGFTKPVAEMSTGNIWDKERPTCKANNLAAIYEPIAYTI